MANTDCPVLLKWATNKLHSIIILIPINGRHSFTSLHPTLDPELGGPTGAKDLLFWILVLTGCFWNSHEPRCLPYTPDIAPARSKPYCGLEFQSPLENPVLRTAKINRYGEINLTHPFLPLPTLSNLAFMILDIFNLSETASTSIWINRFTLININISLLESRSLHSVCLPK